MDLEQRKRDHIIYVAKAKALISCTVTMQLTCTFFYPICTNDAAQLNTYSAFSLEAKTNSIHGVYSEKSTCMISFRINYGFEHWLLFYFLNWDGNAFQIRKRNLIYRADPNANIC